MLTNQSILITGCSTGIGRALAGAFAARGHAVFATARKPDTLGDIAGANIERLALDVNDPDSVKRAVDGAIAKAGRIDILVNNAGYGQMGPIIDLTAEQVRAQFETNIVGLIAMMQAVAPSMIVNKRGRIVNIGSISGILATPYAGIYCASKAAVHSVSEAARMELAPFGIDVIMVQPGGVKSQFGETASEHLDLRLDSPYQRFAKGIATRARASQSHGTDAEIVAKQIVDAATRDAAPTVVRVGYGGHMYPALKRVLPTRMADRLLMKRFGLMGAE
ncbi:MAG: SDR family NAD(P)-dependent oxidoreductase [Candidatus Hydrogenedentes bacterium]|nr:SDR family NAD(P)-dependent oxidoreductase [Candidatus Hydrogenedentota bacterium]